MVAATDIIASWSHAEIDRFALKYGLENVAVGYSRLNNPKPCKQFGKSRLSEWPCNDWRKIPITLRTPYRDSESCRSTNYSERGERLRNRTSSPTIGP